MEQGVLDILVAHSESIEISGDILEDLRTELSQLQTQVHVLCAVITLFIKKSKGPGYEHVLELLLTFRPPSSVNGAVSEAAFNAQETLLAMIS